MALTRAEAATFVVQLPGATAPVSGTVDAVALDTAPVIVAGSNDSYTIALTAAEMDAATRYLLLTDATGEEYGISLVTDESPDIDIAAALTAQGLTTARAAKLDNLDAKVSNGRAVGDTILTHASLDDDFETIGITTPSATITAYLSSDLTTPMRQDTAQVDGEWSIGLTPGATYSLQFEKDGYAPKSYTVTV